MESSFVHVFLILLLFYNPSLPYVLLDSQDSTIEGGDNRYYTIKFDQVMIICLISDVGDADMFASTVTTSPDYGDYEYASTSTGIDVITVPHTGESSLSLAIQGHARYTQSKYRLYVLAPSERDYMDYQVWEVDPQTDQTVLIIEIDPLWLMNEPRLCDMLNKLADGRISNINGDSIELSTFLSNVKDWFIWIIMILLKIVVEVLG